MIDHPERSTGEVREAYEDAYVGGFAVTIAFLCSLGLEKARAEELAQAAWAKGWEKRGSVRQLESLIPWVNTIAFNLFRTSCRRAHREQPLPDTPLAAGSRADKLVRLDVEKGLAICDERERAMLRERYIEGYSSAEVASRHGMNPVTVRVKLMRAKRRLREFFEPPAESAAAA